MPAAFKSLPVMSLPMSFTASFIVFLRRALKTRRRSAARCAFFAELVFAIARYYPKCARCAMRYDASMIGRLEGTVAAVRAGYIVISCAGVGYKVFSTRETLSEV